MLTRDGTAEPVSRDHIFRRKRGQGKIIFPVRLATSRIGNLIRLIHTLLYVMSIHTNIDTYILTVYSTYTRIPFALLLLYPLLIFAILLCLLIL